VKYKKKEKKVLVVNVKKVKALVVELLNSEIKYVSS